MKFDNDENEKLKITFRSKIAKFNGFHTSLKCNKPLRVNVREIYIC